MIRTFTCERCGKPFGKAWFPSRDKPKFCGPECRKSRKTIECEVCKKPFETYASRYSKYCSKKCTNIGVRRKANKICLFCGKYHNKPNKRKYCSYKCCIEHRRSLMPKKTCPYCGKVFSERSRYLKYCSQKCSSKAVGLQLTGENSPNWKGGISYDRGENWRQQSNLARKRDNYTCQQCGKQKFTRPRFPVHHIVPFREFSIERYEEANKLENLITLCTSCHMKTESKSPYHFPIASANKHLKAN